MMVLSIGMCSQGENSFQEEDETTFARETYFTVWGTSAYESFRCNCLEMEIIRITLAVTLLISL